MTEHYPLISCILVTTSSRARWIAHAIHLFQAQTYPNKELVIINEHGQHGRVSSWHTANEHIRYVSIASPIPLSIGTKRNLAAAVAQGEIICTFDDTDYFGPERLWKQVSPILSERASLTAMKMTHVYHLQTGRLWRMSDSLHKRVFPHDVRAGTLMYKSSLTRKDISWPNVSLGEDAWFMNRLMRHGGKLEQVVDPQSYVCVRHGDNGIPEMEYEGPEWTQERVEDYLSPNALEFYAGMRKEGSHG